MLYVDTECLVPYPGLTTIAFTPGVVADMCIPKRETSNMVVCDPGPGGRALEAVSDAVATPSPAPETDDGYGGLLVATLAICAAAVVGVLGAIARDIMNRRRDGGDGGGGGGGGRGGRGGMKRDGHLIWT